MQDGAPEMWNLIHDRLTKLKGDNVIANWEEGIDRYHLLERLAAALEITESNPVDRRILLRRRRDMLDTKDSAIESIEQYFTSSLASAYVSLAVCRFPVGSDVAESTTRTVVGRRAKKSGQRWSESGLRGALTLRAMHQRPPPGIRVTLLTPLRGKHRGGLRRRAWSEVAPHPAHVDSEITPGFLVRRMSTHHEELRRPPPSS